jgi:hypothetical protein
MDNFIVAATNLYAFRAIAQCDARGTKGVEDSVFSRHLDAHLLYGAMLSSIVYHLLEKSKHNMTGTPKSGQYESMALNADRAFAALVVMRFIYAYHKKIDARILTIGLCSLTCMMLSECQHVVSLDRYPIRYTKAFYMLTHCLWHIGAFHTAYLLVSAH